MDLGEVEEVGEVGGEAEEEVGEEIHIWLIEEVGIRDMGLEVEVWVAGGWYLIILSRNVEVGVEVLRGIWAGMGRGIEVGVGIEIGLIGDGMVIEIGIGIGIIGREAQGGMMSGIEKETGMGKIGGGRKKGMGVIGIEKERGIGIDQERKREISIGKEVEIGVVNDNSRNAQANSLELKS